ncbi:MAG: RNA 2',3'-cyclic phosphodiesterase [Candidatus Omnitrophica bacterium]|nr:RNA 2',3'-cyclic phosphodiesterase [Candidatus Omnitrophota bacterium]
MPETIRCFIAIELSQEIKNALSEIQAELKKSVGDVKWVRPENIHLTLKFLGHISPDTVEEVKTALTQIAAKTKPFRIRLSSPGAFPKPERPRVVWIGIDEGNTESVLLANLIEEKLAHLNIEKEEREFHPHLTLGRIDFLKDKDSLKNAFASLKVTPAGMSASEITLFQSTLTRGGAVYTALKEENFTGR